MLKASECACEEEPMKDGNESSPKVKSQVLFPLSVSLSVCLYVLYVCMYVHIPSCPWALGKSHRASSSLTATHLKYYHTTTPLLSQFYCMASFQSLTSPISSNHPSTTPVLCVRTYLSIYVSIYISLDTYIPSYTLL